MTLDNDKTVYQRNFALLFNKNLSSNDAENLEELFTENKEDYHIILYDFENFILYNKKTTKTWGNAFSNIQKLRMISYKKLKKVIIFIMIFLIKCLNIWILRSIKNCILIII